MNSFELHLTLILQELTLVDHTRIYYAPFRKSFYVEVPEIAKMSQAGKPDQILSLILAVLIIAYQIPNFVSKNGKGNSLN